MGCGLPAARVRTGIWLPAPAKAAVCHPQEWYCNEALQCAHHVAIELAEIFWGRCRRTFLGTMTGSAFATLLVGLLSLPVAAHAASLDGVLIYSTDDFGNPIGFDWDTEEMGHGLWRWETQVVGPWGGLGVLSGLPPDSLLDAPINAADFTVSMPLVDGENDFTLVGATGGGNDDYQRLAVNLFFDGILEYPSISVLVPAESPLSGGPPTLNRSDVILSLSSVEPLRMTPEGTYGDGTVTVSVSAASFRRDPALDVAIVAAHSLVADGTNNWIGVLRLFVEETAATNVAPRQGPGRPVSGVNVGGGVYVGPDISRGPQYGERPAAGDQVPTRDREPDAQTPTDALGAENAPPFASPSAASTAAPTTPAEVTSSPGPQVTAAPTEGKRGTPTAAGTPIPSAPTAQASPSGAQTRTARHSETTPSPGASPRHS